jgi:hypothetical protein
MNDEVTQGVKNIIINSYIQEVPAQEMFYVIFHYIKQRKSVEISEKLNFTSVFDYEMLGTAFEYARTWFESEMKTYKLYNRQNELIAVSFGPFIRKENAGGPLP